MEIEPASEVRERRLPVVSLQRQRSAYGTAATIKEGQSGRLRPCNSDVDLFGYGEGIVDLNAEIPDGALNLGMS